MKNKKNPRFFSEGIPTKFLKKVSEWIPKRYFERIPEGYSEEIPEKNCKNARFGNKVYEKFLEKWFE